jgi:hypothetical protein
MNQKLLQKLALPLVASRMGAKWGPKALLALLLAPVSAIAQKPIQLLEPLPGGTSQIQAGGAALDMLNQYMRPLIPWVVGVAMGLAVLMIIVAGFQIMLAGGGQGQQSGKDRIISVVIGIIILVFSATILAMLNADFFRVV